MTRQEAKQLLRKKQILHAEIINLTEKARGGLGVSEQREQQLAKRREEHSKLVSKILDAMEGENE